MATTYPDWMKTERTRWRRESIGFVFQQMGLMPSFSAYENLELMARLGGVPRRERKERILKNLERVDLKDYYAHRPYEMSGGQQQRIAIARALVTSPRLILADEPTSELDSETTHMILAVLQSIVREEGVTILLSSHDPIADDYADRIIHLRDGQIAESPEESKPVASVGGDDLRKVLAYGFASANVLLLFYERHLFIFTMSAWRRA